MEELRDVLLRPGLRSKMAVDPQALLEVIETDTERTPGMMALPGVCRDPKDDKFFACAVEGEADYIVSGDRDLLDIGEYAGIQIIRLLDFVAILDAS
jgi:putative PIN family toxin of toxin-antitoxin system